MCSSPPVRRHGASGSAALPTSGLAAGDVVLASYAARRTLGHGVWTPAGLRALFDVAELMLSDLGEWAVLFTVKPVEAA